jgi:translation initiation factor 4G
MIDNLPTEELHIEKVSRMITATLNKLAPERFDRLSDLILNVGITDEQILGTIIDKIVDKALTEGHFGFMYAKLCQKLSERLPLIQDWISIDQKNNIFRQVLLNKCQREFEAGKNWAVEEAAAREQAKVGAENMTLEERTAFLEAGEKRIKSKIRSLGNVHFVGELFMLNMLTEKIMHRCVTNMLQNVMNPEEAEVESLCKLLTTIGKYLDHPAAAENMKQYFLRIAELSKNEVLPSRIRFMLLDLIDLRRVAWKGKESSGPKTLAAIKKDFDMDIAAAKTDKEVNDEETTETEVKSEVKLKPRPISPHMKPSVSVSSSAGSRYGKLLSLFEIDLILGRMKRGVQLLLQKQYKK